jgi:hypothetical protein
LQALMIVNPSTGFRARDSRNKCAAPNGVLRVAFVAD